ncbi:retrovirus-related pol polyprotein from transposon TNT 1-94 [Tanacetum coccineum]
MLSELSNDGVTLSKHEINVGFVNSVPEKWLSFSQRLRNTNHTQTLDLADIYGRISMKILMMRQMREPDEKEVFDDEEMTQVKVLMALADDELSVGKNHARNGEWINFTMRKRHIMESIWYLNSRCSRSMTSVKGYLYKYVEQPGLKCLHLLHIDLFGPVSPISINQEKYTLVIVDEYSRERIPDSSYFHVFGCPVFIYNHKDHLGKFDAKADDGYFLGYSFVSKAFRVFNTGRQQIEETYNVTFDENIEAIMFTNTSVDEIRYDDSSRYPPNEFRYEDDPSRQYKENYDISYYIIPHGRSFTKLTKDNYAPEVITPNEQNTPYTEDVEGPIDLVNTEGTQEQNVHNELINCQPTKETSRNNTENSVPITEPSVPELPQSQITHHASTSSHLAP